MWLLIATFDERLRSVANALRIATRWPLDRSQCAFCVDDIASAKRQWNSVGAVPSAGGQSSSAAGKVVVLPNEEVLVVLLFRPAISVTFLLLDRALATLIHEPRCRNILVATIDTDWMANPRVVAWTASGKQLPPAFIGPVDLMRYCQTTSDERVAALVGDGDPPAFAASLASQRPPSVVPPHYAVIPLLVSNFCDDSIPQQQGVLLPERQVLNASALCSLLTCIQQSASAPIIAPPRIGQKKSSLASSPPPTLQYWQDLAEAFFAAWEREMSCGQRYFESTPQLRRWAAVADVGLGSPCSDKSGHGWLFVDREMRLVQKAVPREFLRTLGDTVLPASHDEVSKQLGGMMMTTTTEEGTTPRLFRSSLAALDALAVAQRDKKPFLATKAAAIAASRRIQELRMYHNPLLQHISDLTVKQAQRCQEVADLEDKRNRAKERLVAHRTKMTEAANLLRDTTAVLLRTQMEEEAHSTLYASKLADLRAKELSLDEQHRKCVRLEETDIEQWKRDNEATTKRLIAQWDAVRELRRAVADKETALKVITDEINGELARLQQVSSKVQELKDAESRVRKMTQTDLQTTFLDSMTGLASAQIALDKATAGSYVDDPASDHAVDVQGEHSPSSWSEAPGTGAPPLSSHIWRNIAGPSLSSVCHSYHDGLRKVIDVDIAQTREQLDTVGDALLACCRAHCRGSASCTVETGVEEAEWLDRLLIDHDRRCEWEAQLIGHVGFLEALLRAWMRVGQLKSS